MYININSRPYQREASGYLNQRQAVARALSYLDTLIPTISEDNSADEEVELEEEEPQDENPRVREHRVIFEVKETPEIQTKSKSK